MEKSFKFGVPSNNSSIVTAPGLYPVVVVFEDPAPAIVPPVAIILMVGLLFIVIHSTPFIHLAAHLF